MVLILLCGLPGAGKTFFANWVKGAFSKTYSVVHVEFDKIFAEFRLLRRLPPTTASSWTTEDLLAWKASRELFLKQTDLELQHAINGEKASLVIADDNFYYKSMRTPFLQLARKYKTGYVQAYLSASLDKASILNAQRSPELAVPDSVLQKMATRLDPPSLEEGHVIHLGVPPDLKCEKYSIFDVHHQLIQNCSDSRGCLADVIVEVIESARRKPVKVESEAEIRLRQQLVEESREQNRNSILHRLDQTFSKVVGEFVSAHPQRLRQKAGMVAQQTKKKMMAGLKSNINDMMMIMEARNAEDINDFIIKTLITEFCTNLNNNWHIYEAGAGVTQEDRAFCSPK